MNSQAPSSWPDSRNMQVEEAEGAGKQDRGQEVRGQSRGEGDEEGEQRRDVGRWTGQEEQQTCRRADKHN